MNRRFFLQSSVISVAGLALAPITPANAKKIMTVRGHVNANDIGNTLIHEHLLVDFIGAELIHPSRWERKAVAEKMLPYLLSLKELGCSTFVDCTPNYLGRDVLLLKELSERSGLNIVTNTGYYGGSDNRFLPAHAFHESAEQLSARWVKEAVDGIDGTGIRPGFMKISVNDDHLTSVSEKLALAAALTHLKTGLTIASHTGPAIPAFGQLEILSQAGVDANAFIWVHAQNEKDWSHYTRAARKGCWISLDGVSDQNVAEYVSRIEFLKKERCLKHVLVSHDAGWFDPAKPDAEIRKFDTVFLKLVPGLKEKGFSEREISQLISVNPAAAFAIRIRKKKG